MQRIHSLPPLSGQGNRGPCVPRDKAWTPHQVCWTQGPRALPSLCIERIRKSIHAPAQLPGSAGAPVGGEARDPHSRKHHGFQITSPKPPTGREGDTHLPSGSSRSKTWEWYRTLPPLPPLRPPLSGHGNPRIYLSSPFGTFPHCQTPTLRSRASEEGPIWLRPYEAHTEVGTGRSNVLKVLQPC